MSTAQTNTQQFAGKPNYWLFWEICCNVVLAFYFLQFVLVNGVDLVHNAFRLSTLLILCKVSADMAFHLIRRPAQDISKSVWDWVIGIAGAYTMLFYRSIEGQDHLLGQGIQIFGIGLQVFSMLSLNRSIGFVAANRGIKTKGMYRFVRHPLYFSYCVAFFGYFLNHMTVRNAIAYGIMVTALYLRTRCEERLLSKDKEYQEYKRRVKYRLIPYVI